MDSATTNELVEFLRARLDEDERTTRDTGRVTWPSGTMRPSEEAFLSRFNDKRILAEVDAKRAVLAVHRDDGDGYCVGCGFTADEERNYRVDECPTLLALARPYADHPDYRQEWGTPAMAAEITEFMAARLDTLERIARAATRGPWTVSDIAGDLGTADVRSPHGPVTNGRENPACSLEDAHHIAAHSPAYVLQDIEVKRRLLAEHAPSERPGRPVCRTCGDDDVDWPCRTLRILAYTWRYDPEWKQEWRP